MSKIALRDCYIYLEDGLAGTGVSDGGAAAEATTMTIKTVVLNTATPAVVPVGARFTVAGDNTIYTVTAVTPVAPTATTDITFSPPLENLVADLDAITFLTQRLEVKIGDGNITYTEAKDLTYELDRGRIDSVREGDDQPVAINISFVYEFIRTGTSEKISVMDALKGIGGASTWISSDQVDNCNPYAVDLIIEHKPACSGAQVQKEITTFPDFRYDSLQVDLQAASIAATGRSNATEAVVTRVTA